MISVSLRPLRVLVCGRRIHHGLIGLLLCIHDFPDVGHWLGDLTRPEIKAQQPAAITYFPRRRP